MESEILFKHMRNTRKEGIKTFFIFFPVFVILAIGIHIFFYYIAKPTPPTNFYKLFMGVNGAIFLLSLVGYIIPNIIMNKEFSVSITREEIDCKVPSKVYGQSFHLKIKDIDTIIKDTTPESNPNYHIMTVQKEKISITANYENPVRKIIEILQAQNPGIRIIKE
jgi:hypothetical protein